MMVTKLTLYPDASVVQVSTLKLTWCFRGFVNYRRALLAYKESRCNSLTVSFDLTVGEAPRFVFTSMTMLEECENLPCCMEGLCEEG